MTRLKPNWIQSWAIVNKLNMNNAIHVCTQQVDTGKLVV